MSELTRRDLLRLAGAAGLAVALPRPGAAQGAPPEHFYVFVHASGGWDTTMLCDPKGRASEAAEDPVNTYPSSAIAQAGRLRYAPIGNNQAFFEKHHRRTLVLNGVDTQTNNHDSGTRHTWSGKLAEGYPCLAALIAGVGARAAPMAFISNGGYDHTDGLVAPTRFGGANSVGRIAYPNAIDPRNPSGETYHTEATAERIQAALERRRGWLSERFNLPRARATQDALYTARVGKNEIRQLAEYLPGELDRASLKRQAQVCCAAFRAGVAKTANLSLGGFDTHGNHDAAHTARLIELLEGIDFLWDEAQRQGIADALTVIVGSDFGRTPSYNSGQGKDHWAVTSYLLMGRGVSGDRVIGGTDERVRPWTLDPETLEPSDSGLRLEPGHVHAALRQLAGVADAEVARQRYPLLGVRPLPLLG